VKVGDICKHNAVSVDPEEGLCDAARLMREKHVGFLVVAQSNAENADLTVAGVLTDRDIVTAVVAKEADPRTLKVKDIMTRNPLLAEEAHTLEATLRHMRDAGVRRVPVLTMGKLSGVLSLDDVLEAFADHINDIAGVIRCEQTRERTARP